MKRPLYSAILIILIVAAFAAASWCISAYYGPIDSIATARWSNFWAAFNNLVLVATLIMVGYYTYETYQLRKATVEGNVLSFRPILIFYADANLTRLKTNLTRLKTRVMAPH